MGVLSPRSLRMTISLLQSQVSGEDAYGNEEYSLVNLGTYPASVTMGEQSENEDGRDTFTTTYTFVVQASCPIEGVDSVYWNNEVYEVVGNPKAHLLPNGQVHHKEFQGRLFSDYTT